MEDFTVTCPLVPDVPHLRSGSYTSPCTSGLSKIPDFEQGTSFRPHLAMTPLSFLFASGEPLSFGPANTWCEDLHLTGYVPCPAHTLRIRGYEMQRSEATALLAILLHTFVG